MDKLNEKVAIITGGGTGFGRATSILFAKEAAKLIVADCNNKAGEETVRIIEEAGGRATFISCDVSKTKDVQRMVKQAVDTYGRLDILFNNAGIAGQLARVTDTTEESWNRGIGIMLTGVFLGMKYAIPEMLKTGGGAIINTSSISGIGVLPDPQTEYNAAKAGVIGLTRAVAIQFAKENIRVNCILPGHCFTPMIENAAEQFFKGRKHAFIDELNQRQPIGRMGTAEEIAQAVLFLACDETSSFITGATLVIDGGNSIALRGNRI